MAFSKQSRKCIYPSCKMDLDLVCYFDGKNLVADYFKKTVQTVNQNLKFKQLHVRMFD